MKDINCSGFNFVPIGDGDNSFSGDFNGNNHVIYNLNIPYSSSYVGLFAWVTGNISSVGLVNFNISGGDNVGSLAGGSTGVIANSYARGNIISLGGHMYLGGLVADFRGMMSNCYFAGNITTDSNPAGGLIGVNDGGMITNSYWDVNNSGQLIGIGELGASSINTGVEGKTTSEMKNQSTYLTWDFANVWAINNSINDGYPYFKNNNVAQDVIDLPSEPNAPVA